MRCGANSWDPVPAPAQSVVSLPACTQLPYCRLKLENNIQKQKQNLILICMVEIFHIQIQKAEQSPAQITHVSPHSPLGPEKVRSRPGSGGFGAPGGREGTGSGHTEGTEMPQTAAMPQGSQWAPSGWRLLYSCQVEEAIRLDGSPSPTL